MFRILALISALALVACGTPTERSHTPDSVQPQDGLVDAVGNPEFVDVGGRVLDGATGRGLEAARICLTDASAPCARTDREGAFTLPAHPVGARLTVLVYAEGYERSLRPLTVHRDAPTIDVSMLGAGTLDRVAAAAGTEPDVGLSHLLVNVRRWTPQGIEPLEGVQLAPHPRMGGSTWYGARTHRATADSGRAWLLNAVQGTWTLGLSQEQGATDTLLCATSLGWTDGGAQQVPLLPGYVTQVEWTCLSLPDRFTPDRDPVAGPATPERPGVDPAVGFPRADDGADAPVLCPPYDAARHPAAANSPDWGILCPTFAETDLTTPRVEDLAEFPVLCPIAEDPRTQPRAESHIEYMLLCPVAGG